MIDNRELEAKREEENVPDENTVFILGILSLVCIVIFPIAGIVLSIIGYVFGKNLLRWTEENNLPRPKNGYTGYLCSKIALFVGIGIIVLAVLIVILGAVVIYLIAPNYTSHQTVPM